MVSGGSSCSTCTVPRSASPDRAAHLSLYGHGLLGQYTEVRAGNVQRMANEHNIVFCATGGQQKYMEYLQEIQQQQELQSE